MKIDLDKGTYIEIGGELGMYNSLPIDVLIKIAHDFQQLVLVVAKYDLPSDEPIDPNNFKLELVGFSKASAVPKFAYSPRAENKTGINWKIHRDRVNERLENLVEISNSGDYGQLKVVYPEPVKRNPIVESLYAFANSFGTAPVQFVDYDEENQKVTPLYKVNQFKPGVKEDLLAIPMEVEIEPVESVDAIAKVKLKTRGGKLIKHKIVDYYKTLNHSLDFAPTLIIAEQRKYYLRYPLRCSFEKEGDYYVIQSEMLGIVGTGTTNDEAELSFGEEFDYLYQRLNSLQDDELTKHNRSAKTILTQFIEKIEQ